VNIDNAMRWGFGWATGPFQTWDAIGVASSIERMEAEGRTVPAWVKDMLAAGRASFYERDSTGAMNYWCPVNGISTVPTPVGNINVKTLRATKKFVHRTASATLLDMGDGALLLEFHSKMNALDELVFEQYARGLDLLDEGKYEALVVGNQDGKAFSAGANILMILMNAMQQNWDAIDEALVGMQGLLMRAKYSKKPVVVAPYGLTLGGGAEVAMQCTATVAAAELYMGLVEVGVGLIPGGGGCKEMMVRYLGDLPQDAGYDPNPLLQKAFEQIGMGKVATSAEEARAVGMLRPTDMMVINGEDLLSKAKRVALGLAAAGITPPAERTIKVPGRSGRAAIELFLRQMKQGGYASEHDILVGSKLANVLTGGDVPNNTVLTERDLLDLEREAFLSLCGEPKTLERIQYMLEKGKPLRN
jgi:3-hydroxyacyl-CoA dehydrogenase